MLIISENSYSGTIPLVFLGNDEIYNYSRTPLEQPPVI